MKKYDVYLSNVLQVVEIDPQATLYELRQKLKEVDEFNFMYYNDFAEIKSVLNDRSLESERTVEQVVIGEIIQMARVSGGNTDLVGMKADYLYDRDAGVKVTLNTVDENAKKANAGKFQPLMITDVQPTNPNTNAFYDNVVICEKGSVINFNVASWGSAGFGCSIKSSKQTIIDSIYSCYGNNQDRNANMDLRRYEKSKNTIVIDSTENLDIPSGEEIYYQKVTLKTWRLTSYEKDNKTYSSNTQAPLKQANKAASMNSTSGFDPGETEGDTYVPGGDIDNAAPSEGEPSDQSFGKFYIKSEDDRDSKVLGAVVFYFFVFKDKEAANRVINILNSPDPHAIG